MRERVELQYKGQTLEGLILKEDDSYLTLKLKSGYNAILKKTHIEKELKREKVEESSVSKHPYEPDTDLPKITVLHTGGTIASKVDYATGAVSSQFTPEELLGLYPELHSLANFEAYLVANLSSEDMRFEHYNLLLEGIKKAVDDGAEGIIISHGTDTMHYSSAALQYALENLPVPVILVGAQRSSDRPSSDAYSNMRAAVQFILKNRNQELAFRRVGICMHDSISDDAFAVFDGLNVKKMHSSRRDAFQQINYSPYATLDENGELSVYRKELMSQRPNHQLSYQDYDTDLRIGFFKAHPHLFPEEIKALSLYDGVVVEGTGLGHLAVSQFDEHTKINTENLEAIRELLKTTKVIIGVQTTSGITDMNIYSSGRYLLETGVLGNYMNLTTETLFVRSAFLLSYDRDRFHENWKKNWEGFVQRSVDL